MKIDRFRLRKSTSEVPPECQALIDRLRQCSRLQLLAELSKINTWVFGKCELYHWITVLDIFDTILEEAATAIDSNNQWALCCDFKYEPEEKKLLLWTLHFTTLLIEHSFSRHLYSSMEHLLTLLNSFDMQIVLAVLNLLYMFSKRSNFITRLANDRKDALISRLQYMAESWGGKENGFGMADCCNAQKGIPMSATTLHFEFSKNHMSGYESSKSFDINSGWIHIEDIDKLGKSPPELMQTLTTTYFIPPEKEMWLYTHVRLAYHYGNYTSRLLCVQARLQALSVLAYSNAVQDSGCTILYDGLLEELVELVQLDGCSMVDIRSAALRTLTSIIHLDRIPHFPKKIHSKLSSIIDATGANQYHGFLPTLVRNCIVCLTKPTTKTDSIPPIGTSNEERPSTPIAELIPFPRTDISSEFPLPLATSLFSFLYHLASYEAGGEALVSSGALQSLLQVISWQGVELEHITFVTRAVRVIDLITNVDMQAFQSYGGLNIFISRLDTEVQLCQPEQGYEFVLSKSDKPCTSGDAGEETVNNYECVTYPNNFGNTCLPQRAALLKSMLNFLKKAIQDVTFSEIIRQIMDGALPTALKHIVANAEYYGASLFLLATDFITVYVFQDPSLLGIVKDQGIVDVVLFALLTKDIPVTREVLGSVPNVFSALCLNARGLEAFLKYKPFDKVLKVFLSPHYLSAMRRRRSSEPVVDTAAVFGNNMDELIRHQPSLKKDAIAAIVKLLQDVCQLGFDSRFICWRPHSRSEPAHIHVQPVNNPDASSDEEDDEEDETSTSSHTAQGESQDSNIVANNERTAIPLIDYIHNIMKFVDALLSNNATDDHCKEFIKEGGLEPLIKIFGLPNFPVDSPTTASTHAVAAVCKTLLTFTQEPKVFQEGFTQLSSVLEVLKPVFLELGTHKVSVLLHELANAPHIETALQNANATPILHTLAAIHGYVIMFAHICRTGHNEIRALSLEMWGTPTGLKILKDLCRLYKSLVWESTLLLAVCTDKLNSTDFNIGQGLLENLNIPASEKGEASTSFTESPTTTDCSVEIETEPPRTKPTSQQLKYIKPLLSASSRLGRALAELFGLLVKLSVGTNTRLRRGQNLINSLTPTLYANNICTVLTNLVAYGLDYRELPKDHVVKYKLTFLICSSGFTTAMIFDEKLNPHYLMLDKFVLQGGLRAFFNTFQWVLTIQDTVEPNNGLEHPELPDGSGEFLDAWLSLLEKMTDPAELLETPNLNLNLNRALNASTQPFGRSTTGFNALHYLIQVHKLAFDAVSCIWGKKPLPAYGMHMCESMLTILRHIIRVDKIIKEHINKADDKALAPGGTQSDVTEDFLRQLTEMGFSRESALEAAGQTLNVEEATDFLLFNRDQRSRTSGMEVDADDDQVMQAIALSLGEPGPYHETRLLDALHISPIADKKLDDFTDRIVPICLQILQSYPETILKICKLLCTVINRNGPNFRQVVYTTLLQFIKKKFTTLLTSYYFQESGTNMLRELSESEDTNILGNYTQLYTLFFEIPSCLEIRAACADAMYDSGLVNKSVKMVAMAACFMINANKAVDIPWLTPVLHLLDAYEKVVLMTERKKYMLQATNRIWKWYDLTTGKWNTYSTVNNKIINEAYFSGLETVRVSCGRRRYIISFTGMCQLNEETGSNRIVSMTPISIANGRCKYPPDTDNDEMVNEIREKFVTPSMQGLNQQQSANIIRSCVQMLHFPVDKDVLHAILRLCVRYTRDFQNAKVFMEDGGLQCLLNLKSSSGFSGYGTLITVLIRHLLEEHEILVHAFEKVIRGKVFLSTPPAQRELLIILRQLEPAITRSPEIFFGVAKTMLRIDTGIYQHVGDIDARLPVRTEPSVRTHAPLLEEETSMQVVIELLTALLQPIEEPSQLIRKQGNSSSGARELANLKVSDLFRSNASSDILNIDNQDDITMLPQSQTSNEKSAESKTTSVVNEKPLLAKHAILKILADAVVSYGAMAKIITDFTFKSESSSYVTEDCSALAFMFDNLLPLTKLSDRDTSMMCRVLIAAIASANHCPEAQSTLVNELKAALMRALVMQESYKKHTQIQLILGVITTIIENCPPSAQVRMFNKNQPLNGQMNNIVKFMLKKGIFNDLGKLPHYMDLSSPLFPATFNAALKPMESLSRIINQPISNGAGNRSSKRSQNNVDVGATQSGTTSTDATNAQGEEATEDAENTDHDVSAVASSLEEGAMGQILNNDGNELNRTLSTVVTIHNPPNMDMDEDTNATYEPEADATEELMSTDSGDSESNTSDQDVEDDNDDNNDEDDNDDGDDNDDSNGRGDEDVLMVRYVDHEIDESLPRMVRWNETGFGVPLFDEGSHLDHNVAINHSTLIARPNGETISSSNRHSRNANRPRRYQCININPRHAILQSNFRLLGPVTQNLSLNTDEMMINAATQDVMVMDNFSIVTSNEEQIDFVDQSGFLFGPSLLATFNHLPAVLYWWNEEFKLFEDNSAHDLGTYIANELIMKLIVNRNVELAERFKKKDVDKVKSKSGNKTQTKIKINLSKTFVSTHQQTVADEGSRSGNSSNVSEPIVQADQQTDRSTSNSTSAPRLSLSFITIPIRDAPPRDWIMIRQEHIIGVDNGDVRTNNSRELNENNQEPPANNGVIEVNDNDELAQNNSDVIPVNDSDAMSLSDTSQEVQIDDTLPLASSSVDESRIDNVRTPSIASNSSDCSEDTVMNEVFFSSLSPQNDSRSHNFEGAIDDTSHDNLSEIERVASVGLADRQLQEPFVRTDLFEEPNDTPMHSLEMSRTRANVNTVANSNEPHPTRRGHPYLPNPRFHPGNNLSQFRAGRNVAYRQVCPLVPYSYPAFARRSLHNGIFPVRGSPPQYFRCPTAASIVHPAPQLLQPLGGHAPTAPTSEVPESEIIDVVNTSSNDEDCMIIEPIDNVIDVDSSSSASTDDEVVPGTVSDTSSVNITVCEDATFGLSDVPNEYICNLARLAVEVLSETDDSEVSSVPADNSCECVHSTDTSAHLNEEEVAINPLENIVRCSTPAVQYASVESFNTENSDRDSITEDSLPEGVDPSFLAALPAEIQREVLDQFRIVHSSPAPEAGPSCSAAENVIPEVNPEFLAALPLALQEEVLTQQRMEQQRQAAARANPNEPLDAGAFFNTLQPNLRTMILTDMDESQISALPPELANEAQSLRRDWEARNRQMVRERFLQTNLSTLMRQSARGDAGTRIQGHPTQRAHWGSWENCADINVGLPGSSHNSKVRGRQLLDPEALTCLLLMLFVDDSKISTLRLHRVIRNLCYHGPTRDWIMKALLSIIHKCISGTEEETYERPSKRIAKAGLLSNKLVTDNQGIRNDANWLNIRREPALGCCSDIFVVRRSNTGKWTERTNSCSISIHSRAAPAVCKSAIDLVISLSKNFPSCLLPLRLKDDKDDKAKTNTSSPTKNKSEFVDFWDILIKLDSTTSKKGKSMMKNNNTLSSDEPLLNCVNFDQSSFGQLLLTLGAPIVNRNVHLTDKLLHLASVITTGLPEVDKAGNSSKNKSKISKYDSLPVSESCLSLIINIIKTRACSEEGLEDAATLLLNLAKCSLPISRRILNLLIETTNCLGRAVRIQISNMSHDIKKLNKVQKRKLPSENDSDSSGSTNSSSSTSSPTGNSTSASSSKGTLIDRFTKEQVVISPTNRVKSSCDLELTSMTPLISKSSCQTFFLRVLRCTMEVREIIKKLLLEDYASEKSTIDFSTFSIPSLSTQLQDLEKLWETLSACLLELEHLADDHAVLVLQPAVEAFFFVHSPQHGVIDTETLLRPPTAPPTTQSNVSTSDAPGTSASTSEAPSTSSPNAVKDGEEAAKPPMSLDQQKFINFAEKHRTILNQILRQSPVHLSNGPFAVLVNHTKVLDFDIKRRYFRAELERLDEGVRRDELLVTVARGTVFDDSFRELFRRSVEEWKQRFSIAFEGEEGQDAGGLLREWCSIIAKEIFNPMYGLFITAPGDGVTYMINSASWFNPNHLHYFKFIGRFLAKAIYENKPLECYFTRALYKHILGLPIKYTDIASQDFAYFKGLQYLIANNVRNLDYEATFCILEDDFGAKKIIDLIPDGRKILVTEENKKDFVRQSCHYKMTVRIQEQLDALLQGFYDIIPKSLISIFTEQELELMISGLPNIDIDNLKANTEYYKYDENSLQIIWFWRVVRSFNQAEKAKLLQFITGTSRVPLQGFAGLEGMNGIQKFQIHRDEGSTLRLPSSHTCFNQLDLPAYETCEKLRAYLLKAINECNEGFGFA